MISKAKISDAQEIYDLLAGWAKKRKLLSRSLTYIYENIRDFWIYREGNRIVGCCALHSVGWEGMAEVKSLAVEAKCQKKGIGKSLVKKCLAEAKALGFQKVFALTFVPGFFVKMGFAGLDKKDLPHKIWSDCVNCVYFPDCNEEAVIINL
jgi:amino-acid N-acetyltransferase